MSSSPRQPVAAKVPSPLLERFSSEKGILTYLLEEYTEEQVNELTGYMDTGLAFAKILEALAPLRNGLEGERSLTKRPIPPLLIQGLPPAQFTGSLDPLREAVLAGQQIVTLLRDLVSAVTVFAAFVDAHPSIDGSKTHWKSESQLMTAFVLVYAEKGRLKTPTAPSIVALAIRMGWLEFIRDEDERLSVEATWREFVTKATLHLLPTLREILGLAAADTAVSTGGGA